MEYAVWRACERSGLRFPGVGKPSWDDLNVWMQAKLLAYHQVREIEEAEYESKKMEAMIPRPF